MKPFFYILSLMKSYLITDPKYYTNNPLELQKSLEKTFLNHQVDMACFRDKSSENFEELATIFVKSCKEKNIEESFINSNYLLAKRLNATGVHLTSSQFNDIKKAKELGLKVIISCHTKGEINLAIQNGVDMITYSPIFSTPNKGEPKGIEKLQDVCKKYSIPIIALGGIIDERQIEALKKQTQCFGFASIRYFVN